MKHHKLDIKPEPEEVLYVNEPELIDRSLFCSMPYRPKEQSNNVWVYVSLDLNKETTELAKGIYIEDGLF